MRIRALIGVLILPLLFILFSPVYSFSANDLYDEGNSDMLDELELLLEGEFDLEDSDDLSDGKDDLFNEIDTIMDEKSMRFDDEEEEDFDEEDDDFIDIDRYVKIIQVDGGCFKMGDNFGSGHYDERPTHRVCVDDFGIAEYEVTQELWNKVTGMNPSQNVGDDHPVDFISWLDIMDFIVDLNERTDRHFRLPTEAEWEFAARGRGKLEEWPGTNDEDDLIEYAWFEFTSKPTSNPVKKKNPNLLGIYDMSGNVWEWVHDYYDMGYYSESPTNNPEGPDFSVWKGLRGGSYVDDARKIRTSSRYGSVPSRRASNFGFRLAE